MNPEVETENRKLRLAHAKARALLSDAAGRLQGILDDELMRQETPMEVLSAVETSFERIQQALRWLEAAASAKATAAARIPGGPTRQQGQFLAFIREYMLRNQAAVAPRHADFQRFFNLTPPSVNSMLIRLEQRGFIRRVPHQARAIELTVHPDWIPPLERPFKF